MSKADGWPCPIHTVDESLPTCPACAMAVAEGLAGRKVTIEERIPIVADDRVPKGMGWLGYDAEGKLVVAINLDNTTSVVLWDDAPKDSDSDPAAGLPQ